MIELAVANRSPRGVEDDQVAEASEQSFPASDAPSWTTSTARIAAAVVIMRNDPTPTPSMPSSILLAASDGAGS